MAPRVIIKYKFIFCYQEVLQNMICQRCKRNIDEQDIQERLLQPYKLGQSLFTLHHRIDITSAASDDFEIDESDVVMMDDGRLVIYSPLKYRLLICKTDGSQLDSIDVLGVPWFVTAFNNSTVAVVLWGSNCIQLYDINNKLKLKSISVPGIKSLGNGITTINNQLVVVGKNKLLFIDHQTGEMVQTIQIQADCIPDKLHGSGDRIFYCDIDFFSNNNLYWYSYTDDRHHTLTLPSTPSRMTTLQDDSMCVVCLDGSVQHVCSDCKQYKTVTKQGLIELKYHISLISYISKQRKLVTLSYRMKIIKVFHEN